MLPSLGAPRRITSLSCTDAPKALGQGRAGFLHSAELPPHPRGLWIPANPTGSTLKCWPLPGGTLLEGLCFLLQPSQWGPHLPGPLPTISSSATRRTALMRWPTSARSSAGSGTCTSSMVTLSTTGCPTQHRDVSPRGAGHVRARLPGHRLSHGHWDSEPRVGWALSGGARAPGHGLPHRASGG